MDCLNIFYEQVDHSKYDIIINIETKNNVDDDVLYFVAPNPPDYRTSYSGSALPFHNENQAFENTPNKGKVVFKKNKASFGIKYPNSYYKNIGNIQVLPHVDLIYKISGKEYIFSYKLSENPIPYRSLTHPYTRLSPMFYEPKTEKQIASQCTLFTNTAYPKTNISLDNFW